MEVARNQIFNLWNTNGRRRDILNALRLYLEILQEIRAEYPHTQWGAYPESIAQFLFYERAVQYSPDVFKSHPKYDAFVQKLGGHREVFLTRRRRLTDLGLSAADMTLLDEAIELRARNYTSNLVKIGFSDADRTVSDVGAAFLEGYADRDELERILPIDNVNLILLRQLLKLRVVSAPSADGSRTFYSPFCMALLLLFQHERLAKNTFLTVVQGLSPYMDEAKRSLLLGRLNAPAAMEELVWEIDFVVPAPFTGETRLPFDVFSQYIKNQRGDNTVAIYYDFYNALLDFRARRCDETYARLLDCVAANKVKLQKAFGCGRPLFDDADGQITLEEFQVPDSEQGNALLFGQDFNREFYHAYCKSKRADSIWEYSDTTERMLGATGIFKFNPLAELSFREVLACLFDREFLMRNVFGRMSKDEYEQYEERFGRNVTLVELLNYSSEAANEITAQIGAVIGEASPAAIRERVRSKAVDDFTRHIHEKYPREKIAQLLPLFSDRENDDKIKKAVNDTASVPTIYEYIVGIAWYYISNEDFDLYKSLNLTMNADFEPVLHAGGGEGDIVIQYDSLVVMLEVTLMNKQAQKRGEWEPVLRHSLNLKAANEEKETVTYFIADELDYNTINIWRAVAAVPLESTNTHRQVDSVTIMPFTNRELLNILETNIPADHLLEVVKNSFGEVPKITDAEWRNNIFCDLGLEE